MPWVSGAFVTSDGTRTTNVLTKQKADLTYIFAEEIDKVLEDIATGITACLNKNGANSLSGNLSLGNNKIISLANGTGANDAVNKGQLDTKLSLSGGTMTGELNFGETARIVGLLDPVSGNQAVTRNHLEGVGTAELDGRITSRIHANNKRIVWLADGTGPLDAVNKQQLDAVSTVANNAIPKANNADITAVALADGGLRVATTGQVFTKMNTSGGTFTGNIAFNTGVGINLLNANSPINLGSTNRVINMPNPANGGDGCNKTYADTKLALSGGVMTGQLDMDNINIIGVGALVAKTSNPITIQLQSGRTNASAPISWVNSTANNIGANSELLRISTATSASTAFRFLSCFSSGTSDQELYIAQDGSIASDTGFIGSPADYAITLEKVENENLGYGDLVTIKNTKVTKAIEGNRIIGVVRPKEGVSILENDIYTTTLKGDFDEYKDGVRTKIRSLLESKSEKEPHKYVIVGIMGLIPVKKEQISLVPSDWILIEERELSNVYFVK
jgi:hypothetical protein